MRATTSVSPGRKKSINASSSDLPLRLVPDAFSALITVQPAAFKALRWRVRSWSVLLTRS